MYEVFFKLKMKPFELVPNPEMLYPSKAHRRALNYLEYGFKEGAGFMLLTGEVGSGKTTLIRNLIKEMDTATPRAMIFNTMVRPKQLLAMINEEFGLDGTGKDKVQLLRELNDYLVEQYANNLRPMVIIDEAQNLSVNALEEIRLLSNLELDASKLLQIVLVGQPELKDLITQPSLRQLQQRISINCHLRALDREETERYIYHRLEAAGNRDAVKFEAGVFDAIHDFSDGLPRLVNIYCDFLLLAAFMEESRQLSLGLVMDVLNDLAVQTMEAEAKPPKKNVVVSLENRLDRIESLLPENLDLQHFNSVIEKRLSHHEEVIRKLIKTQQNQMRRIDLTLDDMNSKLEKLRPELNRRTEVTDLLTVRVADSGKISF
jgi:putative secretion ATPase (PEP-CTERM system associated)